MSAPPPVPEAPKEPVSVFDTWNEGLQAAKEQLLSEIHGNTVKDMHNFNHLFTKLVLNSPPPDEDVKVDRVPGQGEVQHMPLNILQLTADEIFQGNWSVTSSKFTNSEKKTKNGLIPFVICNVTVRVIYPITGLRRTFTGASDSNMTQTTAAEALMSFALKNAMGKIGKRFGNRYIYAKLDRGYSEDEGVNSVDKAAEATGVPVIMSFPPSPAKTVAPSIAAAIAAASSTPPAPSTAPAASSVPPAASSTPPAPSTGTPPPAATPPAATPPPPNTGAPTTPPPPPFMS